MGELVNHWPHFSGPAPPPESTPRGMGSPCQAAQRIRREPEESKVKGCPARRVGLGPRGAWHGTATQVQPWKHC